MSADSVPISNLEKCSVILLDVAGTTTSINFVKDTLFPYVVKEAENFLKSHWDEEDIKNSVKSLKDSDEELDVVAAIKLLKTLTEQKSDNKGLKTLQGLIYKKGYEGGELKAHVFDDVPEALENWAKSHHQIAIYSTGSVESQKLLFSNTVKGDLSSNITHYFDQMSGLKTEAESYKTIVEKLNTKAEEILFITDNVEEAKAAKTANVNAILVKREGNADIPEEILKEFPVIASFKEINFDNSSKRKIDEELKSSEAPPTKIAKTDPVEKEAEKEIVDESVKTTKEESMEVDATVEVVTDKPETAPEQTDDKTKKTELQEQIAEAISEIIAEAEVEKKPATEEKVETEIKTNDDEKKEEKNEMDDISVDKTETITKSAPQEKEPEKKEEETDNKKEVVAATTNENKSIVDVVEEKVVEKNGEEVESEVVTTEKVVDEVETVKAVVVEEKENKSVLANGVENGKNEESEVDNNKSEQDGGGDNTEKTDEVVNTEETEVLVKKLNESSESTTVSVTV